MRLTISKPVAMLALSLGLLLGSSGAASAVTYGTFKNPFAANSIWNTRLASGARYVDAGFSATEQANFIPGSMGVHKVNPNDPLRKVYKRTSTHFSDYCSGVDQSVMWYQVNLPNSFIVNSSLDNGFHIFVFPNNTVRSGLGWERCAQGGQAAQVYKGEANGYSLAGDGLTDPDMGLGAAGLVSIGGMIRAGELTSPAGAPISHALKVQLVHPTLYCNNSDSTKGYRWPARSADSGACTAGSPRRYEGTNPHVEMGSLLAMLPSYNCNALQTEPGRKICNALRTYGGYVSDSCCNQTTSKESFWMLVFEINTPNDRTVEKELHAQYNIEVSDLKGSAQGATAATCAFKADLDKIYNNMQVITNTSQAAPKGPGTPILAPPMNIQIAAGS
jgi:hypothetical protein